MRGLLLAALLLLATPAFATQATPPACTVSLNAGANIQRELDALPHDGSNAVLCLDNGEYVIDRFIAIERDNTTLRGSGEGTVLRLAPAAQSSILLVGDFHHAQPARVTRNVTIENLHLRGNGDVGSETDPFYPYLTNSGVTVRAGDGIVLRGLTIDDCRSAGILTEYGSRNVAIEGNTVRGAVWDGVSLNRATHTQVIGNTLTNNRAAGITIESLQDGEIRDNVLRDNGSHGIYMADAHRNRIEGNRFLHNDGAGVFITCSIRTRDPVRCWDNSMSADNRFEANTFAENGSGYTIAPDEAANCRNTNVPLNTSRDDAFLDANHEPSWERYGRCLEYSGVKTLGRVP